MGAFEYVTAGDLDVACRLHGDPASTRTVVLLHGFPYDVHAWDEVVPPLVAAGCRVIVPWLRGYGPTRFRSAETLRSGQQGVLGRDLLMLLDALSIDRAVLAGYDWGGRAACIVAALWPERVAGLVSGSGYNIQDIAASTRPAPPEDEYRFWYQYYFHGERGRLGLTANRRDLCRLLWRLWSPQWAFDEATFERSAQAFDNPDFVEVVIHSYRHRYGLAAGAPEAEEIERRLASRPTITVPAIIIDGGCDGVLTGSGCVGHERHFSGRCERRVFPSAGHNLPQEGPDDFARAILALAGT
ncbi:MAG: alpha/beta hydrolase [Burkholderiaceae bacterium]